MSWVVRCEFDATRFVVQELTVGFCLLLFLSFTVYLVITAREHERPTIPKLFFWPLCAGGTTSLYPLLGMFWFDEFDTGANLGVFCCAVICTYALWVLPTWPVAFGDR